MKHLEGDRGALLEEPEYFGATSFQEAIAKHFPGLRSELELDPRLVHVHMALLARELREAIIKADVDTARAVLRFLEDIITRPNVHSEIRNAVKQSFVTPSELKATGGALKLWAAVPPELKRALGEPEARS